MMSRLKISCHCYVTTPLGSGNPIAVKETPSIECSLNRPGSGSSHHGDSLIPIILCLGERDPRKETKMASAWETFVANAVDWLRGASLSHGAGQGFPDEQALTQYLALGLRKEFMEHFGLEADSAALPGHIPFRDGPTPEDKAAWAASQDDKWIAVHGVNFVPDILIRQTPGKSGPVLPVEVKLLKTSGGQGFATAIGQALIYSARYGRAVIFVGVETEASTDKKPFSLEPGPVGEKLMARLAEEGVTVIVRDVRSNS